MPWKASRVNPGSLFVTSMANWEEPYAIHKPWGWMRLGKTRFPFCISRHDGVGLSEWSQWVRSRGVLSLSGHADNHRSSRQQPASQPARKHPALSDPISHQSTTAVDYSSSNSITDCSLFSIPITTNDKCSNATSINATNQVYRVVIQGTS